MTELHALESLRRILRLLRQPTTAANWLTVTVSSQIVPPRELLLLGLLVCLFSLGMLILTANICLHFYSRILFVVLISRFMVIVLPRASPGEKGDDTDQLKPVFVGEFPQLVRDEQTCFSTKNSHPGYYSFR